MKNLFCSLVLVLGVFITAHAQALNVDVINLTTEQWSFKVVDAGTGSDGGIIYPNVASTLFNIPATVTLPFACTLAGMSFACSPNTWYIPVTTSSGLTICGHSITWVLTQPTVDYLLTVTIN